jgi:hypothetical protein
MRYELTDNGWPAIKLMPQSVRYWDADSLTRSHSLIEASWTKAK